MSALADVILHARRRDSLLNCEDRFSPIFTIQQNTYPEGECDGDGDDPCGRMTMSASNSVAKNSTS
jgi:hypothetical protein